MKQASEKLRLNCAPLQIPLGLEADHRGLVDLVSLKAFHFEGPNGEKVVEVILNTFSSHLAPTHPCERVCE